MWFHTFLVTKEVKGKIMKNLESWLCKQQSCGLAWHFFRHQKKSGQYAASSTSIRSSPRTCSDSRSLLICWHLFTILRCVLWLSVCDSQSQHPPSWHHFHDKWSDCWKVMTESVWKCHVLAAVTATETVKRVEVHAESLLLNSGRLRMISTSPWSCSQPRINEIVIPSLFSLCKSLSQNLPWTIEQSLRPRLTWARGLIRLTWPQVWPQACATELRTPVYPHELQYPVGYKPPRQKPRKSIKFISFYTGMRWSSLNA